MRSRRVHETQKLATLPSGALRLSMTVGDTTELASWVLGWGRKATVLEPEALARDVAGELAQALAHYPTHAAPTPAHIKPRASKAPSAPARGRKA